MLAGVPVTAAMTAELASMVRAAGADVHAGRLERALADEVKLLALTIDERAIRRVDETVVRFGFRDAGPRR